MALAVGLLAAAAAGPVAAIELERDPRTPMLLLRGIVQPGDEAQFTRALAGAGAGVEWIGLDSFGGDVKTAMQIGRIIKQRGLKTTVLPGRQCNSACFFIWAGGAARQNPGGILGVHRPHAIYVGGSTAVPPAHLVAQSFAELEAYLREMAIPAAIIDRLLNTPHDTLHVLSPAELRAIPPYQLSAKP